MRYFRVRTENRLDRPWWDFLSDLSAWQVDTGGANQIDATGPDASGFFLSGSLSMRRTTGSDDLEVGQCRPVLEEEGPVIAGRASVASSRRAVLRQ